MSESRPLAPSPSAGPAAATQETPMTARPRGHARRLAVALTATGAVAIGALVPLAAPGAPSAEAADSSLRLWYDESATEGSRISSGGPFRTTTENEIW